MRTLTLRRAVTAAAAPLALALLTGCGSGSSEALAPGASSTPSKPTGSSSPPAATRVSSAAFLNLMKHASTQIRTARFTQNVEVSGQRIPIYGVIDLTGSSPAVRMTMDLTGMGTPSEMLMVDRSVYVEVPGSGGKYYQASLDDPGGPLASLGSSFENFQPGAMMAAVPPRTFAKVTDHGVATVGGRQVHHYTAVMKPRLIRRLPNLPAGAPVPKVAVYDVWLDGQGRLAKFRMRMGRAGTVTGTYADYGLDAHIVAPPAADVMPLPTGSVS